MKNGSNKLKVDRLVSEVLGEETADVTPPSEGGTPNLAETVVRGIMDNFPEASESMDCTSWKYEPLEFTFVDYEEGKKYKLNKEKLLATFPLIRSDKWPRGCTQPPAGNSPEARDDWLCQADAIDFDAFVQLAIFGEVIYG
jgi:hypothetical protein